MIRPASPNWRVPVLTCSAMTGDGIAKAWRKIEDFRAAMTDSGEFSDKRSGQAKAWMWSEIEENLVATLREHPEKKRAWRGWKRMLPPGQLRLALPQGRCCPFFAEHKARHLDAGRRLF